MRVSAHIQTLGCGGRRAKGGAATEELAAVHVLTLTCPSAPVNAGAVALPPDSAASGLGENSGRRRPLNVAARRRGVMPDARLRLINHCDGRVGLGQ